MILSPWALLVVPAAILLGAAFSAAGLATTAYLRTVQDFDLPMGLVVMPMFLFSGTFFPVSSLPGAGAAWLMEVTRCTTATELLRGLTTGLLEPRMIWDLAYLVVFCAHLPVDCHAPDGAQAHQVGGRSPWRPSSTGSAPRM